MGTPFSFQLPSALNAWAPPERRGIRRDKVKLLHLNRKTGQTEHTVFYELGRFLKPGDTLILNNSRTIPAQLTGRDQQQKEVIIRLAQRLTEDKWKVLLINNKTVKAGDIFTFGDHLEAVISSIEDNDPLITLKFSICCQALWDEVYRLGQPIRYEYIQVPWELDYYQTVFASVPGSVEMPSAGRAFSWEMIQRLRAQGVQIGFIQLHTGLSYYEDDRWLSIPSEHIEEYSIPAQTAKLITEAKVNGGRIIAVGTTVVRALESVYKKYGVVKAIHDLTNLYINREFELQVVDGLITGMHEPEASHLDLLSAFIEPEYLKNGYQEALQAGYLWHEFGDMNLII